jgi:serine/threonine protein kinase
MNPGRWQAVGELFEHALALPPGERTACIERASAGDDELRSEVLSLLASHKASPGGFVQEKIKNAVVSFYQATLSHPTSIGPYRVIRELGRGGMGTVFLAECDDGEHSLKVAIKLVRPDMDTEFILARFRRERQTLARMQHPNIARFIDSGTTSQGLPYIVMEYVDGLRITEHARQQKLGVNARIILFLSVCSAVDYAHRNFVIHRDIKPGNILVDSEDRPKLLDFGICKLLADPLSGTGTTDTVAGVLMTPSYASPEQVRGEAVTLLSDVYSLGVVLYELLTDKCFAKVNGHGHARSVMHVSFPSASAVVDDRALKRRLSGDLDNILMRALETDPRRRYESAALLADDLRRHLLDEPVLARPQPLHYRATKFFRRNRGKIAVIAAVFVAFAAFLIVPSRGTHSARLAHVVEDVDDVDAYNSGRGQDALSSFRDSTVEAEEVIASHPRNPSVSTELYRAVASQQLGDRLNQHGDFAEASQAYAESALIAESNLKSGEASFLILLIGSNRKLGLNAIAQAHRDEALDFARRALEVVSKAPPSAGSGFASPRGFSAMALIHADLLRSPLRQADDRNQAISWFRKSVDAWHQAEADAGFGVLQRREMRETEEALASLENR